jgi:hypothetical protein
MTGESVDDPREHLWGPPIRRTLLLASIILGAIASGITIATVEPSITFGVPELASVIAIFVFLLTPIERAVWKAENIWNAPTIGPLVRRFARVQLVALPVIALLGFYVESSQISDNIFTVGTFAFFLSRIWLTLRLRKLVSLLPSSCIAPDAKPVANESTTVPPVIGDCADRKIRSMRGAVSRLLHRRPQIAATCLLVLSVGVALTGIGDGLGWATGKWSRRNPGDNNKNLEHPGGFTKSPETPGSGKGGGGSGGSGSGGSNSDEFEEEAAPCEVISGQGEVPQRVLNEIQSLYAGNQELGPVQTGCPKEVYEESTPEGILYWTLGKARGRKVKNEVKSLAVIPPKRFHNAIVLTPAITWVEGIIKEGQNVGGPRQFPRYYIGGGDIYVLDTEQGSIILAQEETGTAHSAQPLVPLPVSVSFAFLSITRETGIWRWPMAPRKVDRDHEAFGLKQAGLPLSDFRIVYSRIDKTATRNGESSKSDPYTAREQQLINPNDLRRCAPSPPSEERQREEAEETRAEIQERQEAACNLPAH